MTPDPVHLGVRSTGVTQRIGSDRVKGAAQRFTEGLDYARRANAHVWTVIVSHHISDRLAERIVHEPGVEPNLDAESIVAVVIGCFRCEQELDSRIVHRACPGDAEGP